MMNLARLLMGPLVVASIFAAHIWVVIRQDIRRKNARKFWSYYDDYRMEGVGFVPALRAAFRKMRELPDDDTKE